MDFLKKGAKENLITNSERDESILTATNYITEYYSNANAQFDPKCGAGLDFVLFYQREIELAIIFINEICRLYKKVTSEGEISQEEKLMVFQITK